MKRFSLGLWVFALVLASAWAQSADEKKATVAYVQKMQQSNGAFAASAANATPGLRSTSGAVRALKYFGGELPNREGCAKFVESTFDSASEGFADVPGGKVDVATTAVGLMAVAELKLPQERFTTPAVKYLLDNAKSFEEIRIAAAGLEAVEKRPPQANAWLEQVAKMRNPDGTYGKGDGLARDTGSAVVVVLRLGGKVEQPENVLKALKAGQRADGGFGKADASGSDLETTYRVMRAFHMLKEKPADVARLQAFIAKCRNGDGGYGVAPGQPSGVSPTYNAAIILHWLDEQ
jgi:hypothetical protein